MLGEKQSRVGRGRGFVIPFRDVAGSSVRLGYRGEFAMAEKGEGVGNADFAGTSRQKC